jgi:hypothetical protein
MKPLLTRAFVRNAPTATVIAALGLALTGLTAGPAYASSAQPAPAPRAAAARAAAVVPGGPMIPARWRPRADLVITARESPTAPVRRWTLTCRPDGGTLPHPVRACQVLDDVWHPFTPLPRGVMCPMIVYGPEITTITGWWDGKWISVRFSRTYSCQAAQWDRILTMVPAVPAGVNPGGPMVPGPPVRATR